jgi:hypothetical protein
MANSDKNILVTPSVGLSTNPTIKFNGANNTPTTLRVLDDGTVSFEGTAGQLFSIADGMTGTIFSVNDVSGIPNIEVLDTALIKLNQYQGQSIFGSSAAISNTAGNPAQVSIVPKNQITPGLIIKHAPENTATITNISGSGSVVTYTALNTFSAGQYITITGANPSAYNLTNAYTTSVSSTQFTVSSTATGAYVSGGTATTVGQNASNPIFEIQSSSGSAILSVDSSANNPTVRAFQFMSGYHGSLDNSVYMSTFGGTAQIYGNTASSTILKVTGATSQSGNLQEWTSSGGQSLTRVRSSGQFGIGSIITGTALVVNLDILGAATNGMVIRGATSQTGDLALLQTSDGSTLLRFNAQGQVQPQSTAGQAFTIKGVASQSLNLQEWQNSSGSILNSILPSGGLLLNTGNDSTGTQNLTQLTFGYLSSTSQGSYKHWVRSRHNASTGVSNAIEFYTSDGVANGAFPANAVYGLGIENGSISTPKANVNISSASNVGLIVKAAGSQTANIQEWQNSAGSNLATITSSGQVFTPQTLARYFTNRTNSGAYFDSELVSNSFVLEQRTTTAVNLIVKGMASQTGDLQQWQDSAGTVLAKITADGTTTLASGGVDIRGGSSNFTIRNAGTTAYYVNSSLLVGTGYSAGIGVVIRGNGSQTADLQQWQSSGGVSVAKISAYGDLTIPDSRIALGSSSLLGNTFLFVNSAYNTYTPIVARGASGQTANLQEWQDSSGTLLSAIDKAGNLTKGDGDQLVLASQIFG